MRLCSTCRHHAGCALPGQGAGPLAYCEEFEVAPVAERVPELVPAPPALATARDVQGLCGNCLNRDTCQLAGCEGGIWHCEEYQ